MKILVSACLLGKACRYDGRSVPCEQVIRLGEKVEFIPFCPEEAGGLKTPRNAAERKGDRVVTENGTDVTKEYHLGAKLACEEARHHGCTVAILKEKSPSCGLGKIYDGTFSKRLTDGDGVTAECLKKAGIKVLGESQISKLELIKK